MHFCFRIHVLILPLFKKVYVIIEKSWSRGLVKSRQKKWRDSRSRETDGGEKIAATSIPGV